MRIRLRLIVVPNTATTPANARPGEITRNHTTSMNSYFHVYNNEAVVPCSDDWLANQSKLGCQRCKRVETPYPADVELDPTYGELNNFTNLTTRTRLLRPKHDIGGSITMIAASILEAIGKDKIEKAFHLGRIEFRSQHVDTHCTIVPRFPETALWVRSESPLSIVTCDLCGSELHAYDGPSYVAALDLVDAVYPVACSGNQVVVRHDITDRLRALKIPEMVIEPLEIKRQAM